MQVRMGLPGIVKSPIPFKLIKTYTIDNLRCLYAMYRPINRVIKSQLAVEILSAVYGSKQGAHDWYKHFDKSTIEEFGYTRSQIRYW
jgi:hypothetical protein